MSIDLTETERNTDANPGLFTETERESIFVGGYEVDLRPSYGFGQPRTR